jgi:opacity protein-like surface antigen
MRRTAYAAGLVLAGLLCAGEANAQQRVQPAAGTFAAGADVGVFVPRHDLESTISVDVFGAFNLLDRVSVRLLVGYADANRPDSETSLVQTRATASVQYNWEAQEWHPFVLGGVGAYVLMTNSGTRNGPATTKLGVHLGAGIEYFARPNVAVIVEGTYHFVGRTTGGILPSGVVWMAGLKRYF